jgi:hypothetical protein
MDGVERSLAAVEIPSDCEELEPRAQQDAQLEAELEAVLEGELPAELPAELDGMTVAEAVEIEAGQHDRFGFLQDDKRYREGPVGKAKKKDMKKERDRTIKWVKMLKNWDHYKHQKREKLKNRIRKGIPDAMRGAVWPLLIDVSHWRAKYPDAMDPALIATVPEKTRDDITKDLNRTYPKHEIFTDRGFGQGSLERVLIFYAAHDPTANYCQGMGFIAGMFLMYMDEATAFYCMLGALEVRFLLHYRLLLI